MPSDYPLAPRVLAAAGALTVGAYFGVLIPLSLLARGLSWTAAALAATVAPLVLFLLLLAAAPGALQRVLRPVSKLDLKDGGHVAAVVVLAGTLFFVLGYGSIVDGVYAYEASYLPHAPALPELGLPEAPMAPAVNATVNNGTVLLQWSAPPGDILGYRVYRGPTNGTEHRLASLGPVMNFTDDAVPGERAVYRVTAVGAAGEGAASERVVVDMPIETSALGVGIVTNLIVLVLPVLLYVSFVGGHGPAGAFHALGLRTDRLGRALVVGVVSTVLVLAALAAVSYFLEQSSFDLQENARALAIAKALTPLGAFGVALGSAFSEEVFFRGFLMPRIGVLGQAIVFMLAHLNYLNWLELAVTFTLAIVFALIVKRGGNLWASIAAHFSFNLIELLVAIYYA